MASASVTPRDGGARQGARRRTPLPDDDWHALLVEAGITPRPHPGRLLRWGAPYVGSSDQGGCSGGGLRMPTQFGFATGRQTGGGTSSRSATGKVSHG